MSFRRNRTEGSPDVRQGLKLGIGLVLGLVLLLAVANLPRSARPSKKPPSPIGIDPRPEPVRNPILDMLRPPQDREIRDGVAVAVLVDTSGSMKETVRDGPRGQRPKIEIARRCAQDLVSRTAAFALRHRDTPILLGLYEFSTRSNRPACREVVALGPPDAEAAASAIARMRPDGGTPIGDAVIAAKQRLDRAALRRSHILVVTDGENTQGYEPGAVAEALTRLPQEARPAVYFVAFDIAAEKFDAVREAGGLVLGAADATELERTLDYILTGKILVEQPDKPGD